MIMQGDASSTDFIEEISAGLIEQTKEYSGKGMMTSSFSWNVLHWSSNIQATHLQAWTSNRLFERLRMCMTSLQNFEFKCKSNAKTLKTLVTKLRLSIVKM
jgi:hypothetical protein